MPLYISLRDGEREVDYPGYERAEITAMDFTFGYSEAANCSDIRFPECNDEFTGKVTHFATHTRPDGDDFCGYAQIDVPIELKRGVSPNFGPNKLRFYVHPSEMDVFIQHLKEEKEIPCQK